MKRWRYFLCALPVYLAVGYFLIMSKSLSDDAQDWAKMHPNEWSEAATLVSLRVQSSVFLNLGLLGVGVILTFSFLRFIFQSFEDRIRQLEEELGRRRPGA
jgi:hypothetical protein